MPEGPSIVIAVEELAKLKNKVVLELYGNTKVEKERMLGKKILDIFSYGKYLNFQFDVFALRIHFMLFGSYRVNEDRLDREPRLTIAVKRNYANFYSCSVKIIETSNIRGSYDFATDIMSPEWNQKTVVAKIKQLPEESIDDILMDQSIFTGVGNIIKNEVLFRQRMLPTRLVKNITPRNLTKLVEDTRAYSQLFYEWKKKYVLKKHYQIYRKGKCPICEGKVTHANTGKKQRKSHFCPVDQV